MTVIVDYGAGNLRSVQNTLEKLDGRLSWSRINPRSSAGPRKLILPGVGHFGQMMRSIDDLGLPCASRRQPSAQALLSSASVPVCNVSSNPAMNPPKAEASVFSGSVKRFAGSCANSAHGLEHSVANQNFSTLERLGGRKLYLFRAQLLRARHRRHRADLHIHSPLYRRHRAR